MICARDGSWRQFVEDARVFRLCAGGEQRCSGHLRSSEMARCRRQFGRDRIREGSLSKLLLTGYQSRQEKSATDAGVGIRGARGDCPCNTLAVTAMIVNLGDHT